MQRGPGGHAEPLVFRRDRRNPALNGEAAAGIDPGMALHGLRHTYASQLVQNGNTLYVVKDLLGHRSQEPLRAASESLPAGKRLAEPNG